MVAGRITALATALLLGALPAAAAPSDVTSSGTGFFINADGWFVTNAHVLDGCAKATVQAYGEAVDWKVDKQNDLAVARVARGTPKATVPIRQSPPRLGEDVAAFGYPLADVLSDSVKVTTGNVNSLTGIENDTRYLQISTPIQPGNSGGPLLDRSGGLLGIATAQLGAKFAGASGIIPQNVNFAVRASVLNTFLESRSVKFSAVETIGANLSTADLADKVAPAVVQVFCYGGTATAAVAEPAPQQAAMPQRLFQSLDNHDAIGFDYKTLKGVSRVSCQAACEADASCKAATYNKRERFCFLKSGAAILVANSDASTTVAGEVAGSVVFSTFTMGAGRDLPGGDYARIRNSTFIGCYLACEQDYQCRAFAYVRKQRMCWLKNAVGALTTARGVDVGIR